MGSRRTKLWALGVVAILVLAVGIPVFGAGKPTIRLAHQFTGGIGGDFGPWLDAALNKFAQENKNLGNFVFEVEQGDNLRNKIKQDLAADNLPDVFCYWGLSSLKPMIDAGLLQDVSEYMKATKKLKWSDFSDSDWAYFTFDGKKYWGVPQFGFTDFVVANRDLFKKYNLKIPVTYKEFLAVSKVFADNGIIPMSVGSKGGNPAHFYWGEVYFQYGTRESMDGVTNGALSFNTPLTIKTSNVILDMAKNRVFPKDTIASGDFAPAVVLYNNQKAAMIAAETWSIVNFTKESVARSELIHFPRMEDGKFDPKVQCVGGSNNAWNITSKAWNDPAKRPGVIALMDRLTSDDVYQFMNKISFFGAKKVKTTGQEPELFAKVLNFTQAKKKLPMIWAEMPDPVSQEVLSTTLDELWAQNVTAEQFVEKVTASVDKALGK
jgi:raffinose/stachyose/melibiose transport system substrate-binding protein